MWSRIGTGYVYSDDHVTPEVALNEFKMYLNCKGVDHSNLEFKDLKMRIGLHDRIFVKNVCAIGLSAGFIEPLESNGLYTVHMFLVELMRTLDRNQGASGIASEWDKGVFNITCKKMFKEFATFVSMHYGLTQRSDNEYWKACYNRSYDHDLLEESLSHVYGFKNFGLDRTVGKQFYPTGGFPMIATGMGYNPVDRITEKIDEFAVENMISNLDSNKKQWAQAVKTVPTMYEYLNSTIYKE